MHAATRNVLKSSIHRRRRRTKDGEGTEARMIAHNALASKFNPRMDQQTQLPDDKMNEYTQEYKKMNIAAANMVVKMDRLTILLENWRFKCIGSQSAN